MNLFSVEETSINESVARKSVSAKASKKRRFKGNGIGEEQIEILVSMMTVVETFISSFKSKFMYIDAR